MLRYISLAPSQPALRRVLQRPAATHETSPALDGLSLKFVIWSRRAQGVVLDVGCGDGSVTQAAMARGAHVLAIDAEHTAIRQLLARVPSAQHPRLDARVGSLPDMDFKIAPFAAVHAARGLHFLDGDAVQRSMRKFFRWLFPNGKLFISALTPDGPFWEPFRDEFVRRGHAGFRWPGFMDDVTDFFPDYVGGPHSLHLLDESVLRRELEAAGFIIEDVSCYPVPWNSGQHCCGIVARCATAQHV